MCETEKQCFTWHESVDAYDRRIWKLEVRNVPFTAAVIFDYWPGSPPYKLCMLVADIPVSWHDALKEAQQTAIGNVVAWRLHIDQ